VLPPCDKQTSEKEMVCDPYVVHRSSKKKEVVSITALSLSSIQAEDVSTILINTSI